MGCVQSPSTWWQKLRVCDKKLTSTCSPRVLLWPQEVSRGWSNTCWGCPGMSVIKPCVSGRGLGAVRTHAGPSPNVLQCWQALPTPAWHGPGWGLQRSHGNLVLVQDADARTGRGSHSGLWPLPSALAVSAPFLHWQWLSQARKFQMEKEPPCPPLGVGGETWGGAPHNVLPEQRAQRGVCWDWFCQNCCNSDFLAVETSWISWIFTCNYQSWLREKGEAMMLVFLNYRLKEFRLNDWSQADP